VQLLPEEKLILACIKINPSSTEIEQINGLIALIKNWDYLTKTIIDRGIGPLLYKKIPILKNSSLPEDVKLKLQQAYYKTFSRSTILYEHFRRIATEFTSQNIPVIALKGIYLSEWLYQDIGMRQFSDIDLLVKESDASKCLSVLREMGYKPANTADRNLSHLVEEQFDNDIVHYPPMLLNGVSIEIHIKLHRKTEQYNLFVPIVWKNAIPVIINGINVKAMNNNDLLIHLCLHLDKHVCGGHVQFTCYNDITNLLEKLANEIDWENFSEACRLYNCEKIVYKYIVMIYKYMNATIPIGIFRKYGYLVKKRDEQLFRNYLRGYKSETAKLKLSAHFAYIKNLQKPSNKVRYLRDVLFPSKAFMIQTYNIKNNSLVLFYYPYRLYIGIMGVINHFRSKIRS